MQPRRAARRRRHVHAAAAIAAAALAAAALAAAALSAATLSASSFAAAALTAAAILSAVGQHKGNGQLECSLHSGNHWRRNWRPGTNGPHIRCE